MTPKIMKLENYSDLDGSVGRYIFSTGNGSLCSIVRGRDSRIQPIKGIYGRILNGFANDLSPIMEEYGHAIHVCKQYDSTRNRVSSTVERLTLPNKKAAQRIGMDISWLIDSRNKKLAEYCSLVDIYMAIWTTRRSSEKADEVQKFFDNSPVSEISEEFGRRLFDSHGSYVSNVIVDLKSHYIDCELIDCYSAGEFIHRTFNPGSQKTPKLLPDDVRFPREDEDKNILILPQKLNRQLTEAKIIVEDFETIRIGDRIYSSFDLSYFPSEAVTFQQFAERAAIDRLPYRFSMMISSREDEHWKAKYANISKIFSFGDLRESYTRMAAYSKEHKGQIVTAQTSVTTWVDVSNFDNVSDAKKRLN